MKKNNFFTVTKKIIYVLLLSNTTCANKTIDRQRTSEGLSVCKNDFTLKISAKAIFHHMFGHQSNTVGYKQNDDSNTVFTNGVKIPDHIEYSLFNVSSPSVTFEGSKKVSEDFTVTLKSQFSGDLVRDKTVKDISLSLHHKKAGKFIVGNTVGIEERFSHGPYDFGVGTGGTDGGLTKFVALTSECSVEPYMSGNSGVATKMIYITPAIGPLTLGASFTPATQQFGDGKMNTAFNSKNAFKTFGQNNISVGLTLAFQSACTKNSVKFSAVMVTEKTRPEKPDLESIERFNNKSYSMGVTIGLDKMRLGADFIHNGKSGFLKNPIKEAFSPFIDGKTLEKKTYDPAKAGGHYIINTGVGYDGEKIGISLTYLYSQQKTGFLGKDAKESAISKAHAVALGMEYRAIKGFKPFIEAAYYSMSNPDYAYKAAHVTKNTKFSTTVYPSQKSFVLSTGFVIEY